MAVTGEAGGITGQTSLGWSEPKPQAWPGQVPLVGIGRSRGQRGPEFTLEVVREEGCPGGTLQWP